MLRARFSPSIAPPVVIALSALLASWPLLAQTATAPPASGVEQSAIVPHAGSHAASQAPTMQRDCTKEPNACNAAAGGRNASRPEEPKVPN